MDEGDDVPIPPSIGLFEGQLKPIPINDPLIRQLLGEDDLPGIAGVAVVLMEEDSWPNSLARTGYTAFVNAVLTAVADVAASFQHATHAPTKEEIDAAIQTVKDTAASSVEAAIKDAMSIWQKGWYGTFGNNDDTIGSEIFIANHDDFAADAFIEIVRRWDNEGDWQISGMMSGVAPCPADAVATDLLARRTHSGDERLPLGHAVVPGGAVPEPARPRAMVAALTDNLGTTLQVVQQDDAAREALGRLLAATPAILKNPDQPLDPVHVDDARTVLDTLSREKPTVRRAFARRGAVIVAELEGKSWNDAAERIADVPPLGRRRPDRKT